MKMYMVRAGEGNYLFEYFQTQNIVSIGWNDIGDLGNVKELSAIKDSLKLAYPEDKPQSIAMNAGQIFRFVNIFQLDDYVVSYCSEKRIYAIGKIIGQYKFDQTKTDYFHVRSVNWLGSIERDKLSVSTKNSLGSIATIFEIYESARNEILNLLNHTISNGQSSVDVVELPEITESLEQIKEDVEERAHEFIKDKVLNLSWDDMQNLVASIIRAMGFKTRVSPKGSDRGKDIVASPDGLGLEDPRIIIEVKHHKEQMGAPAIRSFLGGLRQGCKAIYVSTGGFTKEARYEAERATIPLTLIDSDFLIELIVSNYDNFDVEGKALVPLRKIYWPA